MSVTPVEILAVALLMTIVALGVAALCRIPSGRRGDGAQQEFERRLSAVPQHSDLRSIAERLNTVERVCDVVRAEISGVKDAITRVERTTNLLLERQLEERA